MLTASSDIKETEIVKTKRRRSSSVSSCLNFFWKIYFTKIYTHWFTYLDFEKSSYYQQLRSRANRNSNETYSTR